MRRIILLYGIDRGCEFIYATIDYSAKLNVIVNKNFIKNMNL